MSARAAAKAELLIEPITGEILDPEKPLEAYDPFRALVIELKAMNAALHFDYEDKHGNKEARSHVAKLRRSKTAVDDARKDLGRAALEYKRRIDAEGNAIIGEFEEMIAVHTGPLEAIEKREADRLAALEARVNDLRNSFSFAIQPTSEDIAARLAEVKVVAIDTTFGEYIAQAAIAKDEAITNLEAQLLTAQQQEAAAAELKRLQDEEAERQRIAREEEIARQAAEAATRAAEAKAAAEAAETERKAQEERDAAARREFELRRQAERAEQERLAAEQRATEAAEAERKRIADAEAAQKAEDERRQADVEHRRAINWKIIDALAVIGITEEQARAVIIALNEGRIPHVSVKY